MRSARLCAAARGVARWGAGRGEQDRPDRRRHVQSLGADDAPSLTRSVRASLPAIRRLIDAAQEREILTVWVNDNYGDWSANAAKLADHALAGQEPALVEPIIPPADAPFVVKARHSVFYETQLEYLLREAGIKRVVLTGQVAEQCILYSALDAYVRHFDVRIAPDAVAHISGDLPTRHCG